MKVTGAAKLEQNLKALDKKVSRKYGRQALRAGAKVIATEAKAQAPAKTGKLRRAVKVRSGKTKKGRLSVLVSIGKKWFTGTTFYGAFVHFGHRQGSRKLGDARRQVEGQPFLEQAADNKSEQAVNTITSELKRMIEGGAK